MRIQPCSSIARAQGPGFGCIGLLLLAGSMVLGTGASAATLRVPSQFPTIQGAINAASDGDVVTILAGTYQPAGTIDTLGKSLTIQGQVGSGATPLVTIDGQSAMTVIRCANGEGPDTLFENLIIKNGFSSQSGGGMLITNAAGPTLSNCVFIDNVADCNGGAVGNINTPGQSPCSPSFVNCTFEGNVTNCNGGAVYNDSGLILFAYCDFRKNNADFGGGFYDLAGVSVMINSTFNCNDASIGGGALYLESSSVATISDCDFEQNRAVTAGGGIFFNSNSQSLQGSSVCGNLPNQTQGVYFNAGGNTVASTCTSCADPNGDGIVDGADLAILLSSWGTCAGSTCPGDLNGDGLVDGADLALILSSWGPCFGCP